MTAKWQAGKTYVPGSLVVPLSSAPVVNTAIANAGFESGDLTSWDQAAGSWSVSNIAPYQGSYSAQLSVGAGSLDMSDYIPVAAGQQITATVQVQLINSGNNDGDGAIALLWFDASLGALGAAVGSHVTGSGGHYKPSTVSAAAPAQGYVKIRFAATAPSSGGYIQFDNASWDYAYANPSPGIVYKATQAAPGKSGTTEPAWPGIVGVPVTDNEVTWEGEIATRIVWQASPLARSGDTEPAWPGENGAAVHDGTIDWIAQTPQITDVNCPHSTIVVIAASKVYAADNDIVRFSATVNPLDWSTANDAGYLAFGLQLYGSNPAKAMNLYRSNVCVFNAEGFQNWQVDEDPANTALLDALPIASTFHAAMAPTATDLFFLSSKGVRSVGISATGVSLQNGDVGMPIDVLVRARMAMATSYKNQPLATYLPAEGQYWLAFSDPFIDPWVSVLSKQFKDSDGNDITLPFTTSDTPYILLPAEQIIGMLTGTQSIVGIRATGTILDQHTGNTVHLCGFQLHKNPDLKFFQFRVCDGSPIVLPETLITNESIAGLGVVLCINGTSGPGPFTLNITQLDFQIHDTAVHNPGSSEVFVYTINHPNAPGKWSRYLFPFAIDAFTQLNDFLYLRSGDAIIRVDPDALIDCEGSAFEGYPPAPFDGVIWWPWLDLESPGVDKQFLGVDVVGTGIPTLDVGYDQSNIDAFTTPFDVPADSVPGQLIPIECMAPSFSVRITYKGGTAGQKWQLQAVNMYWQNMRKTS